MTVYYCTNEPQIQYTRFASVRRKINVVLLFLFVLNALFVPADPFEVKKLAMFALLVLNCDSFWRMRAKDERWIFLVGTVLTTVTILISILWTGNIVENISLGYVGYILLLYPIIRQYRIDFVKMVIHVLTLMSYFIVIMGLLDLIGFISVYDNPYLMWLADSKNAMVGKGSHLPIGFAIFMKASPMIFLGIAYSFLNPKSFLAPYSFTKLKFVNAAVMCLAMVLSGTRANMFLCLFFAAFCAVYQIKSQVKRNTFIFAMFVLLLFFLGDGALLNSIVDMFIRKASSDAVRNDTLDSILAVWEKNPRSLLLGSGYSATFYNTGRGEYVSSVEISYWNLLRQVGLFLFVAMMAMYLYPAMKMLKEQKNTLIILAYVAYLGVAYTNPLLFSSTGMTLLLFMYCLCFDDIDYEKETIEEGLLS